MLAMQRVISGMQSVPMLAIPFFVAAGALMNYCGITDRMLKFCKVLTGHMYGGLGQVNIVLSTLMGGMSGSSLADAAMEAKLLVPDMRKSRISKRVCICYHRIFFNDHTFDPAGNRSDYLRKCNRNFYRPPVCGMYCSCCHPLRGDDDNCIKIFQENVAFRALARRGHLAESFGKHLSPQSFLCAFRSSSSEVSVWVSVLLPRLVQSQLLMQ